MRCTSLLGLGILGLALIAPACRSSSGGNGDDDDTQPDAPKGLTIQDIQNDAMPAGTAVALDGVIVTAIDAFGSKTGDFWIEMPDGGPFSGIHVFGAPASQVAALHVGDIVSLTGAVKDEFALASDTTGRTITELKTPQGGMMTVTKTGTGTVPAPVMVDVLAIGRKATQAERDAEWEQWEGVLIKTDNVTAFGSPICIKSMGVCTDPMFSSFSVTGVAKAESQLAAFPAGIARGDCFASVTGVVDYFFDYLIFPRSTDEMVTGGTGCAAPEQANGTDGAACTNGSDDDGNGFADCMDLGCEVGANAWLGATCGAADTTCGCSAHAATGGGAANISAQTNPGALIMNDPVVVAVGKNGFWIADALAAAVGHGAFVFLGSTVTPPASVVIGATVATLQGLSAPFTLKAGGQPLNELSNPTLGTVTAPAAAPTAIAATLTDVGDITAGAPYAGVLVQLSNLKVTTAPTNNKGKATLTDNGGKTILMNDFAFGPMTGNGYGGVATAVGTCYSTIVGVMDEDTTNQVRTLNPRIVADMTVGAGCN